MPVFQDPKDLRPGDIQEMYPFGERCPNLRGHSAHCWQVAVNLDSLALAEPDVETLRCNGHGRCGKQGLHLCEGTNYPTNCSSNLDHEGDCSDDIWGQFTPSD